MRLFLSEFLTSGALQTDATLKSSLAVEGAAMLRALATDAAALAGHQIAITWDAALPPFDVPNVEVHLATSPVHELDLFRHLAASADLTFVIAPEFDRLLETRARLVAELGGRFAGSAPDAIALCADKLTLAAHLERHGLPTIPTTRCDFDALPARFNFPPVGGFVVKPRFGAGSVSLFRVRYAAAIPEARKAFTADDSYGEPLLQPYIPGLPLSIAAIVSPSGIELFPVAEQQIVGENLHYVGGTIPADLEDTTAIQDLARRTLASIPGLRGYVGLDLLLPEVGHGFGPPLVVEINPRLTTSYLGYRQLASTNLTPRLLTPDRPHAPITWQPRRIEFAPV